MSGTYQEPGEVRPKVRGNNCKSSMVEWEGQQAWCGALPPHYLLAVQPWTIHFFIGKVGIEGGKRGREKKYIHRLFYSQGLHFPLHDSMTSRGIIIPNLWIF